MAFCLRTALLGASPAIPFVAGGLTLGAWQQILYSDNRPRQREMVVHVMGE